MSNFSPGQLLTAAALNAAFASTLAQDSSGNISVTGNASIGGALTLSGNPTTALQAATKGYADLMLPLAGGTMTGALIAPVSTSTSIASGTSSARTLAARAADVINVKDYGAKGDCQTKSVACTISSGTTTLTVGSATFFSTDVGKTILVPGAGSAGGNLITTIAGFASSTSVTLTASASTSLSAATKTIVWGTDDSAAINSAVAVCRTLITAPNGFNLYFPYAVYLIASSINMTNLTAFRNQISGNGSNLYGICTGKPIVDAMGARWLRFYNLNYWGDANATPNIGIQIGRTGSGVAADYNEFSFVTCTGSFSTCAFYNLASEATTWDSCYFSNQYTGGAAYTLIQDGLNHFNASSQFVTITTPVDTDQSFIGDMFVNTKILWEGSSSGTPIWMGDTWQHRYLGCYVANATGTYAAIVYCGPNSNLMLYFDTHCETATLTDVFFVTGPSTTVTITGFTYIDVNPHASNSLFKTDQTTVNLNLLDLQIASFVVAGCNVFDNGAAWVVGGKIAIPAATRWTNAQPNTYNVQALIGRNLSVWSKGAGGFNAGDPSNTSNNQNTFTSGAFNQAINTSGVAMGQGNVITGQYSSAPGGQAGVDRGVAGTLVWASSSFATAGDAQTTKRVYRQATTDATQTALTTTGSSTATAANSFFVPTNSSIAAKGVAVARNTSTGDTATWEINAVAAKCGATASTLALVGTPTITKVQSDAGASSWALTLAANTTLGAIVPEITGAAATTIRTVLELTSVEVRS